MRKHGRRRAARKSLMLGVAAAAGVLVPLAGAALIYWLAPHVSVPAAAALVALSALSALRAIAEYFLMVRPALGLERALNAYLRTLRPEDGALDALLADQPPEKVLVALMREQGLALMRQDREEAARQETELYALQSQINPHFLYNALDSIRGFALIHGVDEIAGMAEALSNLFHTIIARQGQLVSLREELDNVGNYMEIQQFRFNNRFHYVCEIDEEIQRAYTIPNLTLQPIVENGIMHGLENKLGRGDITITGYATDARLILSVHDNGVGMDDAAMEQLNRRLSAGTDSPHAPAGRHSGIALVNINRRLKLKFGEQYGLTVMSTQGVGTTVEVTLPLCPAEDHVRSLYE